MHPDAAEIALAGVRRLALRDLVFVVREDQVHPAAVDLEAVAEVALGHRRALDVPAGAAFAPRAVEAPGVADAAFPEREVERVALVFAGLDAGADAHLVEVSLGELAVARERADRVVDVARAGLHLGDVGRAVLDERLDDRDDLADVLADLRLDVGHDAAELADVLLVLGREAGGERGRHLASLVRALQDLVVDVGHVAHVRHLRALAAEVADHDVGRERGARVADVGDVVGRRPAAIDADLAAFSGDDALELAARGCRGAGA